MQKRPFQFISLIICIAAAGLLPLSAAVAESTIDSQARYVPHTNLINTAIREYYRLRGEWPRSWEEVRASELVQADLFGPQGELLSPDDGRLDFPGDVIYIAPSEADPAALMSALPLEAGLPAYNNTLQPPQTFAELLQQLPADQRSALPDLQIEAQWKLFSLAALLRIGMEDFFSSHGRLPDSLAELLASGQTTIDTSSINPVTGRPFAGDAQAGDFVFELVESKRPKSVSYRLLPVAPDGKPILYVY